MLRSHHRAALGAVLQRFGIDDTGQFAVHVIEDVGHGILRKTGETGIRRPAQVRRENHVVELQQRMIRRQRLLDKDIQRRAGDGVLLEDFYQGSFVNDGAPRRIDEVGRFFQSRSRASFSKFLL